MIRSYVLYIDKWKTNAYNKSIDNINQLQVLGGEAVAYPIKGYLLQQSEYIKEIDSEADIYIHEATKAKVLLIANKDPHKSFCIGFRTPPKDSTGVPHIIEHSVLCGSRKYPLKDPFVELAKGSLNTYLNAMTYPDKTLYPISSQNDKDFQNLMDVYLDAVFFPNIYKQKEILMQEGWRYHLEDAKAPIEYKGVVYNEMKGAFSSPEEIGFRLIKETLFPHTTYAHESGGAPAHIPDLSYEAFIDFHKSYYHPSNSYICLYGDMDPEKTLEYIDKEYLSKFSYMEIDSHIAEELAFKEVVTKTGYYSATPDKDNGLFLSYNFVVGDVGNRQLMLAMSILEYVLLDTPASPLKKALIAEGIGEDVYGAFQTHLKQPVFTIVGKNVVEDKKQRFYEVIHEVLEDLAKNGLPEHLLKGALQVKEFELREGDSSGYSKGLFYSLAAMKSWIYDASPFVYLKYEEELAALKTNLKNGYYEELIKQHILNNKHCAKVELYPKVGLEKEIEDAVTEKLAAYKASLSEKELQALIEATKHFNAFQMTPDAEGAAECIPLLQREDLRRKAKYPKYVVRKEQETDYVVTTVFTNKIAYVNWHISLIGIEDKHMPYLGMIVGMLGKLDTKHYTYEALSSHIDEHIGSMSYHIQALNDANQRDGYLPTFLIQSKALINEVSEQVRMMGEILQNTLFDNADRLLEIIREMKALMESAISSEGHRIAYSRLLAHLSSTELFEEKTKGITFYHFVCDIEKNWSSVKDQTISALKEAYGYLANKKRITVGLTVDEEEASQIIPIIQNQIDDLPEAKIEPLVMKFDITEEKEAMIYPSNVNYVAMGYNFKEQGYNYHGGMLMLKTVLSMDYLWSKVRVQNGAYGCFCDFRRSGNMFFVSYRDPNIDQTLELYKEIPSYLEVLQLSDRELLQYLIGTISQMDFPFTPATEGKTAQTYYLMGIKEHQLQQSRDELFATTNETLKQFAPLVKECLEKEYYCVFGNAQNVENAQTEFKDQTIV